MQMNNATNLVFFSLSVQEVDKIWKKLFQVILELPLAEHLMARAKLECYSVSSCAACIIEADMVAWQAEKGINTEAAGFERVN